MHIEAILKRAELLIEQGRNDDAVRELGNALNEAPDNAHVLTLLAYVYNAKDEHARALELATQSRGIEPGNAFTHFVGGLALIGLKRYPEALNYGKAALAIAPEWPGAHALCAQALYFQEKFKESLEASEKGLSFDPDNSQCLNLRAMALMRLRRHDEAQGGLAATLAADPLDPVGHGNLGWSLLHQGRSKEAELHFRESLRLAPGNEYARLGVIEAIKARNPVFRVLLVGLLWFSSLSSQVKVGIILMGFFGFRFVRSWGAENPEYAAYVTAFTYLYMSLVFLTWAWAPLTNCTLFLHPFGRQALTRRERAASATMLGCLLCAASCAVVGATMYNGLATDAALVFLLGAIPVAVCFEVTPGKSRIFCIAYTIALFVAGLGAILSHPSLLGAWVPENVVSALYLAWLLLLIAWFWGIGHALPRDTGGRRR